jgi:hypothetical protein
MAITLLPTAPKRTDSPDVFITNSDTFIAALPQFVTDANALAANLNSIAAGGAYAIPYTFKTGQVASTDPGTGKIGLLTSGAQNATTAIYVDVLNSANTDVTTLLDSMSTSTSAVLGQLRLVKQGDASKWLTFNVNSVGAPTGYRVYYVTPTGSSSASPFVDTDAVLLFFQRTGDIGPTGTLTRRVQTVVNTNGPVPDMNNYDMYVLTAAAQGVTLGVPTGTLTDGRQLMYRIKDNGTAQTLAYNAIYRAPTEIPFPSTTVVGKWTYLGFVYNATDSKWDLVAALSNM